MDKNTNKQLLYIHNIIQILIDIIFIIILSIECNISTPYNMIRLFNSNTNGYYNYLFLFINIDDS